MKRDIIIHNYDGSTITQIHTPFESGVSIHPPIHLFRSNDHYEILLDNSKKPNKNICPLPDVSAIYGVVDLTFSDSEEEDEPEIASEEEDSDECMIRFN